MQLDQSENFFADDVQGNLHVRLSKYTLQYFSDGWTKRLCRSIFFLRERYAVQLCQKAERMVAGDVDFFFAPRNEKFKEIDIKTWIMEKRMHDTCQHKYVL